MTQPIQTELTMVAFTTIRNLTEDKGLFGRQKPADRLAAAHALADAMHNFDPTNDVTLPIVRDRLSALDRQFPFCMDHAPALRSFAGVGLDNQ